MGGRLPVLALALMGAGCGVEHLPPPQAPARLGPEGAFLLPERAPPPGSGRLVIETEGEQAEVAEVSATDDAAVVAVTPLCTTPCVVDLPYGPHPLIFQSTTDPARQSETRVDVGPRAKILRHSMGERRDAGGANTVGVTLLVLGTIAAATGLLLWSASATAPEDGRSSLAASGQTVSVGGAALALLGIPLLLCDRPSERPGATTVWALPARSEPADPTGRDLENANESTSARR